MMSEDIPIIDMEISDDSNIELESDEVNSGTDEAIDLVYRVFCRPGKDNVVAIAPTYGMYEVCADVNDVEYRYSCFLWL